ncbi:MAG: nicotinate (nicotinamide) nucleotide adenylyltransferase [Candidatus Omnitrophica bacterium]|nr:nicotinate (nicotinamide) nucleotide adenylyltransferase [Candidatus Omnitrophota bacterium]
MKVALYGGTFNPPHNGHLHVADEVYRLLHVDQIFFIPAFIPPHKSPYGIIAADARIDMVKAAIADKPFCAVSDIEVMSGQVCYTIDTVRTIKSEHPEWDDLYFIIGSDSIPDIYTWKQCEVLCQEVTIVVVKRPGYYSAQHDKRFVYLDNVPCAASSTEIRSTIRNGHVPEDLMPPAVVDYIKKHSLY